jgi:nucleoside-diphosphate-sugar epimerase
VSADRRVLVTGAGGFVGRHTLAPLVAREYEVHATGRRACPAGLGDLPITWHEADLLDADARDRLLRAVEPSHLLHVAWHLESGKGTASPLNVDWIAASLLLGRAFVEGGGRRLVGVGSCFEYEHGVTPILAETSPLLAATVYGQAKAACFEGLSTLARATGLSTAWARLFYLYGPHEDRRRLVGDIASAVLEGREVATQDGLVRRDYMYVEDAGAALAALLDSDVPGPVNIATGTAPTVRSLVEAVGRAAGDLDRIRFGAREAPPNDPPEIRADVTRLRDEVEWFDLTPTDEGVRRTVEWWRTQVVGAPA